MKICHGTRRCGISQQQIDLVPSSNTRILPALKEPIGHRQEFEIRQRQQVYWSYCFADALTPVPSEFQAAGDSVHIRRG